MNFNTQIDVTLKPHFCNKWPEIVLSLDNSIIFEGKLEEQRIFNIDVNATVGQHILTIEFKGKTNDDSKDNQDLAIEIHSIAFEKIATDRMIWAGVYTPDYPEPWASEQKLKGIELPKTLTNATYLGWNGEWTLTFDVPIFTWIHKLENLGWIYN